MINNNITIASSNTTTWFVVNSDNSGNFTVYSDPIDKMKEDFAKLKDKFFEGHEIHTNMEIIQRWRQDKRLAELVS